MAALLLLSVAAAQAFSQSANTVGSNSHIGLNVTGSSNFSLSLYISFVRNSSNTTAQRHYYPIHLSHSQFTAQTTLHVTSLGTNHSQVSLYNPDFSTLAPQGINVIIVPNNGTAPFYANVSLAINPATPSGLYKITVFAAGANNSANRTVLHLKVYNPTNTTFLESHMNQTESQNKSAT
ncbi:MAG: hypothetical protein KGH66_02240, partial [Candidatus Micrarchaeota archaeon]|nr:hypothetical protein [Candidatus Micrarchaeota archaeon]